MRGGDISFSKLNQKIEGAPALANLIFWTAGGSFGPDGLTPAARAQRPETFLETFHKNKGAFQNCTFENGSNFWF